MVRLAESLARRTWHELRALARAHNLGFDNNWTRLVAVERLCASLLEDGRLRRRVNGLGAPERELLVALQAAGGSLSRTEFVSVYGPIRPYRPWREDTPPQPWKQPISAAETLWYLGLIDVRRDTVIAPVEVLKLLPPLPRPQAALTEITAPVVSSSALLIDLAVFLGTLLYEAFPVRWERWLPPRALKAIHARCRVKDPAAVTARSELQTGRLRFLHYLAEATGLVSLQDGALRPAPAAWEWLNASTETQWDRLWHSVERDLARRDPLWARYRQPPTTFRLWHTLCEELERLEPGTFYSLASLIATLRPRLPGQSLASLPELLNGPLSWAGMVTTDGEAVAATKPTFATPQDAAISLTDEAICVPLPAFPHLRPLVEVLTWAEPGGNTLQIAAESARRAVQHGQSALHMADALSRLTGQPLPISIFEQLVTWERQHNRLKLRQQVVLTSPDTDLLRSVLADRDMRRMIEAPLSAHHLAVKPECAADLARKLERRGLPVNTPFNCFSAPMSSSDLTPDRAAYLWLAGRIAQGLRTLVSVLIPMPGDALDWLREQLSSGQADLLDQQAASVLDDLRRLIAGDVSAALPSPLAQDDPAAIRGAIERAFANRAALTIDYFSPAQGAITRRTIEPVMPIVQRGDLAYVEAWCREAEAMRTFRLDRIIRVVQANEEGYDEK